MAQAHEFTYPSQDGRHQIHAVEWLPEGTPRAVLQIVHGVAEYIARYDPAAQYLADQGILVCGEDHLGHGLTAAPDERGYFAPEQGWELVVRDVHALRQLQGEKYPDLPYFILGHSMGSFLTRTFLCDYPGEVTGAILSGTGQESALNVWAGKLVAEHLCRTKGGKYLSAFVDKCSLGGYNKKFLPNRTSADWLSRDEHQVDLYLADPLCGFQPTVRMFADLMGGLQYISNPKNLARMDKDTPVFFFSGSEDPVGNMGKGVKKVYGYFDAQGVKDLDLILYPGGRHEMFNEINRDEVLADLLKWLNKHIKA